MQLCLFTTLHLFGAETPGSLPRACDLLLCEGRGGRKWQRLRGSSVASKSESKYHEAYTPMHLQHDVVGLLV